MTAIELLGKEKQIDPAELLEALKTSLVSAYRKYYDAGEDVEVVISKKGEIKVIAKKTVCEEVLDITEQISLEDALLVKADAKIGDVIEIENTPKNFGRIAAQNAKQMMVQHIREAERGKLYSEYHEKEGELIMATVQKREKRGILIEIGTTETIMPTHEQIPGESYNTGDKIAVMVIEVRNTAKGLQIMVSRTHPGLVRKLFEREVPEIADGVVEIKSIAREAGSRTKIAVYSNNENVDAVGSCVGHKGARVSGVLSELGNEKIDIIKYSEDPVTYITEALSPAKVMSVTVNEEEKSAEVIVPDYQLSLAIGKEGQNARLAARLTGWKIDIKCDKQSGEVFGFGE